MKQIFNITLAETFCFHGKRDTILKNEQIMSKYFVTIVKEPDSQCAGHFTPQTGSSGSISNRIIFFFK